MSKRIVTLMLAALFALPLAGRVVATDPQGAPFRKLNPPQPTESPGKIEVIEFFSYACPHCNEFYPLLSAWMAQQKPDVVLRKVPVGFDRPPWVNLQRAFYALKVSGDLARLDGELFRAIHEKHEMLFDESALDNWVGRNGGDASAFASAYTSFAVNNDTVQADQMAAVYGVEGVPTMAVNGEYVAQGSTLPEILANTSKLIERVRAERAAKAAH
jgi:thiol:disulfide interchange protein DsbA